MAAFPHRLVAGAGALALLCACASQPPATGQQFGAPVVLSTAQPASFPDGLEVRLEGIDDSRCHPGVQCIWAGELSARLRVQGGALVDPLLLRLGSLRTREQMQGPYRFVLGDATPEQATVTVSKSGP